MTIRHLPNRLIIATGCLLVLTLGLLGSYPYLASNIEALREIRSYTFGCINCQMSPEVLQGDSLYLAGRISYLNGDDTRGQEIFAQLSPASYRRTFILLTQGDAAYARGDEAEAVREWKNAGAALFMLWRAHASAEQGNEDLTYQWARLASIVDPSPKIVDQSLELIRNLSDANKKIEFYTSVAQASGVDSAMGQRMLGQWAIARWKNGEAVTYLEKSVKINPNDASAWFYLGQAAEYSGDLTKAESAYLQSIKSNTANPNYYGALASLYEKIGSTQKAITAYEKATSLGGYWHYWDRLALLYANNGSIPLAEATCRRALILWPGQNLECVKY